MPILIFIRVEFDEFKLSSSQTQTKWVEFELNRRKTRLEVVYLSNTWGSCSVSKRTASRTRVLFRNNSICFRPYSDIILPYNIVCPPWGLVVFLPEDHYFPVTWWYIWIHGRNTRDKFTFSFIDWMITS